MTRLRPAGFAGQGRPRDGSPTRFWHQVRDQAAHAALGLAVQALWLGLAAIASLPAWPGIPLALAVGGAREAVQWRTLHTPRLLDSVVDAAFWPIGAGLAYIVYLAGFAGIGG